MLTQGKTTIQWETVVQDLLKFWWRDDFFLSAKKKESKEKKTID